MIQPQCLLNKICRSAAVERKFPGDRERLARMSLIDGTQYFGLYEQS